MARPPHVALLIETSLAYGRGLLRGISRYIHEHGPWSVYFRPQGLDASPPRWLARWQGDGILARINDRQTARAVLRTKLPVVDLRAAVPGLGLPGVGPDNRIIAQEAFSHFLDSGIRHFGFYGEPPGVNWFLEVRRNHFRQLANESGHACKIHCSSAAIKPNASWEQEQGRLVRWLQKLPKPIGIMACDDDHGLDLLDACQRAGIVVPDQVAVIGVNNDEQLCGLTNPPMSSIDVHSERIGYEAAAILSRLMKGGSPPEEVVEFPPRGLVVRQSSTVIGVADKHVAEALRYIRDHVGEKLTVAQVAEAVDLSRSTLERRFSQWLGRTPKEELLRVQIQRAQELLLNTNLTIAEVAHKSGFRSTEYFHELFRKRTHGTPGAFRREKGFVSRHT